MTLENDPEYQKLGIVGYSLSWLNLAMGIVERSGIWDRDDVIVEVSVGVTCGI